MFPADNTVPFILDNPFALELITVDNELGAIIDPHGHLWTSKWSLIMVQCPFL